ncbi:PhzF family phenazine biosynthesis protein [Erythrobacter sp. YT30]|uniref:PhzF family phenazine biosynthesis protein n=1 Tax=Erythrobacter sp. YT30 TaxID=1735012 RepID=UPI00076DB23B|nr:PhzF family phenazine biosynthesis protein [Erythrobacter sp. YT30]KWV91354.1 PhzF family phenazine biosynthesis protein [Erythrobacter sp. YT30]
MMRIPYWHVDAFSARAHGGNQAAVMLLDSWLTDDKLQAIAAENMFAATAFAVADHTGDADWELRWFAPSGEISLCGHATLAAGHVLLPQSEAKCVTFRTRQSGYLVVRQAKVGVEIGLPVIATRPSTQAVAIAALGSTPIATHSSTIRHHIFLFEDEQAIRSLSPDFSTLANIGDDQFICTARGRASDFISRVFVPGAGVNEDCVTGSAHAALAPFWAQRLGKNNLTAYQASCRGGHVRCRMDGDRVWLDGPCVTVVEGAYLLD